MEQQAQASASPARVGLYKRLAAKCSRHGGVCLAIIIVLVVILVVGCIYYRGLLMFGPYASVSRPKKKHVDKDTKPADDGDTGKSSTDSETANLIQSINSAGSE